MRRRAFAAAAGHHRFGMMLEDSGSPWFISGAPDARWNDDDLNAGLRQLTGADLEAVDSTGLMADSDPGAVRN